MENATSKLASPLTIPLKISLIYALLGGLWILFSDLLLSLISNDPGVITRFEILKGWFFVAVTSLILYLLIRRDILTVRRSEQALRESQERFRLLIERVTDYEIFMVDQEGYIVSWNIGAELSKGYPAEEVIGKHHSIFFTPEDIKKGVPEKELLVAATADRCEDEGWRVRKDGSLFWANVVTTSLRDKEGHLHGYSKVVKDITTRKVTEEKLRESEARYRIIAESASDAIVTIDEESTVIFASAAVEKIFGYRPDELIGGSLDKLMPARSREVHSSAMTRYLETGEKTISWKARELPGLHRNGREVPLEISFGEFMKDGRRFFSGIIRDISERKQAEKEKEYRDLLERFTGELETLVAERTMSLMALKLADSVRNPAAVIGWTGRRLMREEVPEKMKKGLEDIVHEADRLETLVKDFQALLKTRKSVFSYEDINEIVRAVVPIFESETAGKRVDLAVTLSDQPLKMNIQKDLLRVAIFNLLRNAFEAVGEEGKITVVTSGDGSRVFLTVSDTGPGIPEEIIGSIFDPFFSTKGYRFGMGLPIIKHIVSEHLGKIEVESLVGKGTTFRIILPARWSETAEAQQLGTAEKPEEASLE